MLREHAPAKLNLNLHIVGKRADGYHLLESMVVFTELGDVLEVAVAPQLSLMIEGPFALELSPENNSVMKAAHALRQAAGTNSGAAMKLFKNLPVASGIGGGSADAAAALRALSRLWNVALDKETMHRIALSLGADMPVCLAGKPALMSGVGEKLQPLPSVTALSLLLVNPAMPLETRSVFARYKSAFTPAQPHMGWEDVQRTSNDLQPAAIELQPVIAQVLELIETQPGCRFARMSGSGATCFGLFSSDAQAKDAASNIAAEQPNWWVQATRSLT